MVKINNMNILVTGSNGFIGRHLCNKLQSYNANEVYKIDNFSTSIQNKLSIEMDITNSLCAEKILRDIGKVDIVYHLGSPCSNIQFTEDKNMINRTLAGFSNIIDYCKRSDAKLIFPSSGNVYGNSRSTSENKSIPIPTNDYSKTKIKAENMVKESGLNYMCLRIFLGYGPGEELKGRLSSVVYQFLNDIRNNNSPIIWGNGMQTRDYVYIDDIVQCLINAIDCNNMTINIGTGISFNFIDLIKMINKILNKDIIPKFIEAPNNYVINAKANNVLSRKHLRIKYTPIEYGIKTFNRYLNDKKL